MSSTKKRKWHIVKPHTRTIGTKKVRVKRHAKPMPKSCQAIRKAVGEPIAIKKCLTLRDISAVLLTKTEIHTDGEVDLISLSILNQQL